jgi:cytosine/adenosine deaminase-related metal-dependent hydrolase
VPNFIVSKGRRGIKMKKVDLLIEGGWIITMDSKRRIIDNGAVAIRGNTIAAVGKTNEIKSEYTARKTISAKDKLIIPGLVDAHIHTHHSLTKGMIDDIPCNPWCDQAFAFCFANLDPESYYISALITCLQMMRTGTTSYVECGTVPPMEDRIVKAIEETGMRAVVGRVMWDLFEGPGFKSYPTRSRGAKRENTKEALARGEDFINHSNGSANGRIHTWFSLHQVPNCSPKLCRGVRELADKYDVGILTHAGVVEEMVQWTVERFGMRDIEYLNSVGILGPDFLAAHMAWITGREMMLIRDTGSHIVHNVSSSLKGGYGSVSRGKFPEMISAGINVALGCDGANCSNHLDMVREMFVAAVAHKEIRQDTTVMPPELVLEMATLNGAKAMKLERKIGSLEPGKLADLTLFDLNRPEWVPTHQFNVVRNLVYSASGDSVNTVIIDGKITVENGRCVTVDEDAIYREARRLIKPFIRVKAKAVQKEAKGKPKNELWRLV